ncbi:MAG: thiaminase II [Acidilobaceae archaeon]|nr:thiaminase II [Acidilobaceae archaeon]MCX8164979.1 thiaminase II [Acidilobaceae archaeon]MDW7974504.1 thiaminase II [Sulfolobales archaeon]
MSVTVQLRESIREVWEKDLEHPFVVELYDGRLPLEKFKYYLLQDYNYLVYMVKVLSVLASKAPSLELSRTALELAYGTVTGEMKNYESLLNSLGLTLEQAVRTRPNPTNVAYMNFLLSTALSEDFYAGLASVLPCFWSYREIAERHRERLKGNRVEIYKKWASVYLSEEYSALVSVLRRALDDSGQRAERLLPFFELGTKYEYLFWSASYNMEEWPI